MINKLLITESCTKSWKWFFNDAEVSYDSSTFKNYGKYKVVVEVTPIFEETISTSIEFEITQINISFDTEKKYSSRFLTGTSTLGLLENAGFEHPDRIIILDLQFNAPEIKEYIVDKVGVDARIFVEMSEYSLEATPVKAYYVSNYSSAKYINVNYIFDIKTLNIVPTLY